MRRLYLFAGIYIGFALTGCSSTGVPPTALNQTAAYNPTPLLKQPITLQVASSDTEQCSIKDPIAISCYPSGKKLTKPYKVLASKRISKFNMGGIQRQEATIHDMFRQMAASMGGDAVIDISGDGKTVSGTVVQYKKTA